LQGEYDGMTSQINDYDIQAYVDGELEKEDKKRIWRFIAANPSAMRRYKQLCEQKEALRNWWTGVYH